MGTIQAANLQQLALVAVVLLAVVALLAAIQMLLSGHGEQRREQDAVPATPSGARPDRLDNAARTLASLIADGRPGGVEAMRQRLCTVEGESAPQTTGEVAEGMVMIARVVPSAARQATTLSLLSKLHRQVGSRDFLYVCGQIAAALRQPEYRDLAAGLHEGELSWVEFLFLLRSLPLAEVPGLYQTGSAASRFEAAPAADVPSVNIRML
ncbi:MAG TPA: hypothetical protein VGM19_00185 [Armatimonadota bacterium]|jgi:hypothetical protein